MQFSERFEAMYVVVAFKEISLVLSKLKILLPRKKANSWIWIGFFKTIQSYFILLDSDWHLCIAK